MFERLGKELTQDLAHNRSPTLEGAPLGLAFHRV